MQRKPEAKSQAAILVRELKAAGLDFQHQKALEIVAKMSGFKDWNTMSKSAADAPAVGYVDNPMDRFNPQRNIAVIWSIEDVQEIRPDLTDEEAFDVLKQADRKHDASVGINWDSLESTADWMYRDRVVPCLLYRADSPSNQPEPAKVNLSNGRIIAVDGDEEETDEELEGEVVFEGIDGGRFCVEEGLLFGGNPCELADITLKLKDAGLLPAIVPN